MLLFLPCWRRWALCGFVQVLCLGSCQLMHQLHLEPGVQHNCKQRFIASLALKLCLWFSLALDTISDLFQLNPAEWFCNTARICGGDLVLPFEEAGHFTANTLQKFLQQRKTFTSFIAFFDNLCILFAFCSGRCEKPLERWIQRAQTFIFEQRKQCTDISVPHSEPSFWDWFWPKTVSQSFLCQPTATTSISGANRGGWRNPLEWGQGVTRDLWSPTSLFNSPAPEVLQPCGKSHNHFRARTSAAGNWWALGWGRNSAIQLFFFFFAWEQDKNTAAFSWFVDSYFWVFSLDVILLTVPFSLHKLLNLPPYYQN